MSTAKKVLVVAACIAASFLAFSQTIVYEKVTTRLSLLWNANPPEEMVEYYHVYIQGVNGTQAERVYTNYSTKVAFTNLLADLPNGQYTAWLTAVGVSGLESLPSQQLAIFWYGNRPSPPTFPNPHLVR